MDIYILIASALGVLLVGIGGGYLLHRKMTAARFRLAEQKAREAVEEAKKEAEAVRKEAEIQAKDHFFQAKAEFEAEAKERRQEFLNLEKRLLQKEDNLEKQSRSSRPERVRPVQAGKSFAPAGKELSEIKRRNIPR